MTVDAHTPSEIRTGLIGFGLSGSTFHAPLLAANPAFRLTAIATRKADVAMPGVRATTVEALLSDAAVSLVIITTPNATHASLVEAALNAGKHVVVEKPFALEVRDAERLTALARERGLCLTVFHNRRWDGDFLTVRQLLTDGALGRLYSFESHFDRLRPQVKARWKEEDVPGAGTLWDLGSHLIDQAVQLFGLPDTVLADLGHQRPGAKAVDWVHLVLRYGELRVVLHSGSVVHEPWPRFVVRGDRDAYVKTGLDPQEAQLHEGLRPGQAGWGVEPAERHGRLLASAQSVPTLPGTYEAFYRQLASAITHDAPVPVSPDSAQDVLRVVEAALRSDAEGRRVALR
ncbi:oxidoreductase [Corallococcus sp. M34]|uniref:oxidoreductase n=1 Tax=Citreicoccus inhibens TaxID=2849499 RepID=UPI001C218900|nr:oxidoreductase [Citreicoccus inhibens]MBU8894836.1 oxidoreductase [Citreicoccus inhibens]